MEKNINAIKNIDILIKCIKKNVRFFLMHFYFKKIKPGSWRVNK